jgi:hypothetical protein
MNTVTIATTDSRAVQFLIKRLPAHLKRMIYLASISGAATNTKEPDAEFINKLNKIMHLSATGSNALKLPIYINSIIWKHKEYIQKDLEVLKNPLANPFQKQECIGRINRCTPSWFKYADSDIVMEDLKTLFHPSNQLFSVVINDESTVKRWYKFL